MKQCDLLMIGGGPAGFSAAVNGRRRNKRVLLVGKEKAVVNCAKPTRSIIIWASPRSAGRIWRPIPEHALAEGVELQEDEIRNFWPEEAGFPGHGKKTVVYGKNGDHRLRHARKRRRSPVRNAWSGKASATVPPVTACFSAGKRCFTFPNWKREKRKPTSLPILRRGLLPSPLQRGIQSVGSPYSSGLWPGGSLAWRGKGDRGGDFGGRIRGGWGLYRSGQPASGQLDAGPGVGKRVH